MPAFGPSLTLATVAERLAGFLLIHKNGSEDIARVATTSFLQKDAAGTFTASGNGSKFIDVLTTANGSNATPAEMGIISASYQIGGISPCGIVSRNSFSNDNGHWLGFRTTSAAGTTSLRWEINKDGSFLPAADNAVNVGAPSVRVGTFFAVTGTINTSDERLKRDIEEIPETWLDAWARVRHVRFHFIDGSRWHTGLIAQRVHAAFAAEGIDAFEIGLCGFDTWEAEYEPIIDTVQKVRTFETIVYEQVGVDEAGNALFRGKEARVEEAYTEEVDTGEKRLVREAGDRWNLRYDECAIMEAAWQRRENIRTAELIADLTARVAELEAR